MYQLATLPSIYSLAVLQQGPLGYLFEPVPWGRFAESLRPTLSPGAECPRCQGTGNIADHDNDGAAIDCHLCGGTGVLDKDLDPEDPETEDILPPAEYHAQVLLDAGRLNAWLTDISPADAWRRKPTLDLRICRGHRQHRIAWRNRETVALTWTVVGAHPCTARALEHAA